MREGAQTVSWMPQWAEEIINKKNPNTTCSVVHDKVYCPYIQLTWENSLPDTHSFRHTHTHTRAHTRVLMKGKKKTRRKRFGIPTVIFTFLWDDRVIVVHQSMKSLSVNELHADKLPTPESDTEKTGTGFIYLFDQMVTMTSK